MHPVDRVTVRFFVYYFACNPIMLDRLTLRDALESEEPGLVRFASLVHVVTNPLDMWYSAC